MIIKIKVIDGKLKTDKEVNIPWVKNPWHLGIFTQAIYTKGQYVQSCILISIHNESALRTSMGSF
jgi:hypothetical protein